MEGYVEALGYFSRTGKGFWKWSIYIYIYDSFALAPVSLQDMTFFLSCCWKCSEQSDPWSLARCTPAKAIYWQFSGAISVPSSCTIFRGIFPHGSAAFHLSLGPPLRPKPNPAPPCTASGGELLWHRGPGCSGTSGARTGARVGGGPRGAVKPSKPPGEAGKGRCPVVVFEDRPQTRRFRHLIGYGSLAPPLRFRPHRGQASNTWARAHLRRKGPFGLSETARRRCTGPWPKRPC